MEKPRSKVYFYPLETEDQRTKAAFAVKVILEHHRFQLLNAFCDHDLVGVKIDSAQNDHDSAAVDSCVVGTLDALNTSGVDAFLCDTSSRFKNRHANAVRHFWNVMRSGPGDRRYLAPFFLLDGVDGSAEFIVRNPKATTKEVFLAGELPNLQGLVVVSRRNTTDPMSALEHLGLGLAGKRGKIKLHSDSKPKVNPEHCFGCRKCLRECPTEAIILTGKVVEIREELCVDCGRCVEAAHFGGISYLWNIHPETLRRRLVD